MLHIVGMDKTITHSLQECVVMVRNPLEVGRSGIKKALLWAVSGEHRAKDLKELDLDRDSLSLESPWFAMGHPERCLQV